MSALFYTEKIYYLENGTIMCIEYNKKEKCSIIENEELKAYANSKLIEFPSKELAQKDIDASVFLIERGAMNFTKEEIVNISDKECHLFEYDLDYKKLNIDELAKFSMTSSQLEIYSNFTNQVCLYENGDRMFSNLTYTINAIPTFYTRLLTITSEATLFEIPQTLSNESQLLEYFYLYRDTEANFYACIYDDDPENCFKSEAVYNNDASYCQMAGSKKDDCLLIIGTTKLDLGLCTLIENTDKKDDCFLEISSKLKTIECCEDIQNQTKKESCISFITE